MRFTIGPTYLNNMFLIYNQFFNVEQIKRFQTPPVIEIHLSIIKDLY